MLSMKDMKNTLSLPSNMFKEGEFEESKLTFDLLFVSVGNQREDLLKKQVILISCIFM